MAKGANIRNVSSIYTVHEIGNWRLCGVILIALGSLIHFLRFKKMAKSLELYILPPRNFDLAFNKSALASISEKGFISRAKGGVKAKNFLLGSGLLLLPSLDS